jgi:negative regulator of flagellin synthesis FlgM
MTERINGQGFRPADTPGARRPDAAKPTGKGGEAQTAASTQASVDTVNVTRSGLLMSKLEELVHGLPVVDADRVRAVKEALASGRYEIDDQRVADNMIRLDRELLA